MSTASWVQFIVFVARHRRHGGPHRAVHGPGLRRRRRRHRAIASSVQSSVSSTGSAGSTRRASSGGRRTPTRCSASASSRSSPSTCFQRFQEWLPLNPTDVGNVIPHLSFNTAVSFMTNTNWQSYGGESTMSHLTQMIGLDGAELRVGGRRHGHRRRADPRPGPAPRLDDRELLGRPDPHRRSASCCRCRSSSPSCSSARA